MTPPTLRDVLAARTRIRPHLSPTPLRRSPALSRLVGADIWVKHENLNPTGAFKVRGGINLISQLTPAERETGVISASTGNHGQSIAFAARLFGIRATICAPARANRLKVESMRDLGANVVLEGRNFDEAALRAEQLAEENGYRFVHSGNEPHLIAGVGPHTLEVFEELPDTEVVIVPIGGGSGAAGASIVASAVAPDVEVIGVQSAQAPAAYQAWRDKTMDKTSNTTTVEGLSTGTPFALPQAIIRDLLSDFVLLDDAAIQAAIRPMIEGTRTLVEGAGAAPLAAALHLRERLAGRRVVLICSGANITPEQLMAAISD
jgi:threonine dehydratase